jgi:putative oxidoreductase
MYLLLQTPFSLAALIIRVALGVVMFPHGAQKVLGWFGGSSFADAVPPGKGHPNPSSWEGIISLVTGPP